MFALAHIAADGLGLRESAHVRIEISAELLFGSEDMISGGFGPFSE